MVRSWLLFAFVTIGIVGCTRANGAFCDEQTPCSDSRPCDLSKNECTSGVCVPNETTCNGDVLVVCDGSGEGATEETCEFGCNSDREACNECAPSAADCAAGGGPDQLTICSDDGELLVDRECFLGCRAEELECIDVDPSNGLAEDLDFIDESPAELVDLVLGAGFEVNSSGLILDDGTPLETVNSRLAVNGPNNIRVFRVRSLHVTGDITLVGDVPIAFVSDRAIQIDGVVLVQAGRISMGACVGGIGDEDNGDRGGNGGAGHARVGASGGDADGANAGGGGSGYGNQSLEPLLGGCDGGRASGPLAGGMGGGALQLVSREPIRISASGALGAVGQGGGFEITATANRVSGGGSGGSILIEAPRFEPAPGAFISANGGGGGCSMMSGEDGMFAFAVASGANCSSGNGDGGDGAAEADPNADQGRDGNGDEVSGGGGGGAFGRIRVNVADNADPPSIFFSPPYDNGDLATR